MQLETTESESVLSEQEQSINALEELDLIEASEITVGHAFHAFKFFAS